MERSRWTDDLLDERMAAVDEKFDRLLTENRALREDMRAGFSELRAEMRAGFSELRAEMVALHRQVIWILGGLAVGLLGVLGAQL